MTRELAALLCIALVVFLFWRDLNKQDTQRISWAPFVWMAIAGSRFVSHWLQLRGPADVAAYDEGSPVDRLVFSFLIAWGAVVLHRRNIDWRQLLSQNKWLAAYLLYCLAGIVWTPEPLILAKRWVKELGNPIMVLVLLTERRPYDAIITTVRRLAFLLLPVSVLFIKYYPEFGRGYTSSGAPMYTGIADQKNTLGLSCLIIGMCYIATFVTTRKLADRYDLITAAMLVWLLYMSNSKTALACLIVAAGILVCSRVGAVMRRPSRLIPIVAFSAGLYLGADALFQVQDNLLGLLGRSPTLTNRTHIWATLLTFDTNPLVGTGFMSFWTGDRMAAAWTAFGAQLNQAHSGYLEQYLNLGYVGVGFIVAVAISGLLRVRRDVNTEYPFAVLRLCFLVTALLYNYTEASFYGINNMWVLFLAASITAAGVRRAEDVPMPVRPVRSRSRGQMPERWRHVPRPRFVARTPEGNGTVSRAPHRTRLTRRTGSPTTASEATSPVSSSTSAKHRT